MHVYDDVTYVCDDVTGTQSAGHAQPRRSPVRLCDTECVLHRMCSPQNVFSIECAVPQDRHLLLTKRILTKRILTKPILTNQTADGGRVKDGAVPQDRHLG